MNTRYSSYRWLIVASGALIMAVTHGVIANCFSLYIQPVTAALSMTRQSFSLNQTIVNMIYMVISLLSGRIYQRFNAVRLMRIAAVTLPLSYYIYSFCQQPWHFWTISALVGLSVAFLTFLPLTLIISQWFQDRQGTAIGICFMGSGVGGMLFNAIGGQLVAASGWQATYRTIAVVMIFILVPLVWFVIRSAPQHETASSAAGAQAAAPSDGLTVREAFGSVALWALLLAALIIGLTTTILSNTIIPHLTDIGYEATYASTVMSVYMGLLAVCKVLLGNLNDRLGARLSTGLAVGAVIIGLLGLYLARIQSLHVLIVAGAALGCASCTVSYPLITRSAFGPRSYIALYGIVNAANSLSTSFAQVFSNTIFDSTGSYDIALLICAALAAISLALLPLVRPYKKARS